MTVEVLKQMVEALYYLEMTARTKSSELEEALLQANQALKVGRQAIANAEPQASPWKEYWLDIVKENNDLHERLAEAEKQEPVVVVGSGFQLLWTGGSSFADHARKHGIKVGSLLYTHPRTKQEPLHVSAEDVQEIARLYKEGRIAPEGMYPPPAQPKREPRR